MRTTRQLQANVRAAKQGDSPPSRAGRPRTPDFVRALRLLDEAVTLLANEDDWAAEIRRFRFCESNQVIEGAADRLADLSGKVDRLRAVYQDDGDVDFE